MARLKSKKKKKIKQKTKLLSELLKPEKKLRLEAEDEPLKKFINKVKFKRLPKVAVTKAAQECLSATFSGESTTTRRLLRSKQVDDDCLRNIPEVLEDMIYGYLIEGESNDEVLIRFGKYYNVERDDTKTLAPGEWISGDILTMVCLKLTLHMKKKYPENMQPIWYLPHHMSDAAKDGRKERLEWLVRSFFRPKVYVGSMEYCEHIVMPVNHGDNHWYLVVVHVRAKKAYIVDSINNRKSMKVNEVGKLLKSLDYAMQMHCEPYQGELSCITPVFLEDVPQQKNSFDCGIFVARHMLLGNINSFAMTVDCERDRRYVAGQLFYDPYNEVQEEITRKVYDPLRATKAEFGNTFGRGSSACFPWKLC